MTHGYSVFTSNVDGHFQEAGFDERDVREYHGSIHDLQCLEPCSRDTWAADEFEPVTDVAACGLSSNPPLYPRCGGLATAVNATTLTPSNSSTRPWL